MWTVQYTFLPLVTPCTKKCSNVPIKAGKYEECNQVNMKVNINVKCRNVQTRVHSHAHGSARLYLNAVVL